MVEGDGRGGGDDIGSSCGGLELQRTAGDCGRSSVGVRARKSPGAGVVLSQADGRPEVGQDAAEQIVSRIGAAQDESAHGSTHGDAGEIGVYLNRIDPGLARIDCHRLRRRVDVDDTAGLEAIGRGIDPVHADCQRAGGRRGVAEVDHAAGARPKGTEIGDEGGAALARRRAGIDARKCHGSRERRGHALDGKGAEARLGEPVVDTTGALGRGDAAGEDHVTATDRGGEGAGHGVRGVPIRHISGDGSGTRAQ